MLQLMQHILHHTKSVRIDMYLAQRTLTVQAFESWVARADYSAKLIHRAVCGAGAGRSIQADFRYQINTQYRGVHVSRPDTKTSHTVWIDIHVVFTIYMTYARYM